LGKGTVGCLKEKWKGELAPLLGPYDGVFLFDLKCRIISANNYEAMQNNYEIEGSISGAPASEKNGEQPAFFEFDFLTTTFVLYMNRHLEIQSLIEEFPSRTINFILTLNSRIQLIIVEFFTKSYGKCLERVIEDNDGL